ncbi:tyrosine-type recombinase/integrase [Pontibacter populi]|uniref:Tyrosine-type recombinase/integrase n=1 Tax=Pontibacter populi TaxID=890055 RepID=A0ABV1RSP6_9BACT
MFTDPQAYHPENLTKRSFISFYYKGLRYRYYHGKAIGVLLYPNKAKTLQERERLIRQLVRAFTKALLTGWTPDDTTTQPSVKPRQIALKEVIRLLIADAYNSSYSNTYKRDVSGTADQLLGWLEAQGKQAVLVKEITAADIERFLQQYTSSGTYYQNKRRTLSAIFSKMVKQGYLGSNPVLVTSKRKAKAVLHQAYTTDQLARLLPYLKVNYPNLYLCAILMYGLLLRPHQEIRLLERRHFNKDLTLYMLEGKENKSGKIRSLPVPEFVREVLLEREVLLLLPNHNLLTGGAWAYNESYLNTQWSRAKKKMLELKMIEANQTLYSFRHAASVNVFKRTQNLKLLQQLLGHSSLNTSLIYLRSVGAVDVEVSQMPSLDF